MIMTVKSLDKTGIAEFENWLDHSSVEPPRYLLQDDRGSEFMGGVYQVDTSRIFSTSYELGQYLVNEVFIGVEDRFGLLADYDMWSWLSLAFIDSLVKKGRGTGAGKPLAKPHYTLQSPRLTYRLITRTSWDLVFLHGEAAKVALGSLKSPWGEMAEQMTSRQEIYAHRSFWPVANALYASLDGSVKMGATSQRTREASRDPKNKTGLGSIRRLPFTFKQFERTYNLRQMTNDQISYLLPIEYKKWLANL